jgi:hypothetical protein
MSLVLSNGWAFLLTQQKNLAKYISIPHSEIKLQKFCSDHKIDNTTEFVASNYPKIIVSMPRSESGTPKPKRNYVSIYVPCNMQ